jgi:hypothetical protein
MLVRPVGALANPGAFSLEWTNQHLPLREMMAQRVVPE